MTPGPMIAGLTWLEWAERLSDIVTRFGFPLALGVFLDEQRKARSSEQEEIYQRRSDEYTDFLKLVLGSADLQLLRKREAERELTEEQKERKFTLFSVLVSLFERAYLLVYEDRVDTSMQKILP